MVEDRLGDVGLIETVTGKTITRDEYLEIVTELSSKFDETVNVIIDVLNKGLAKFDN